MEFQKKQVKIYYKKQMFKKALTMNDYALVFETSVSKPPNHSNESMLEAYFELFNWVHEGFQPNDPELGFNRNGADHTSMSVGDIVEIDGIKYLCAGSGWTEVQMGA
ncbi:MAG: hypothetical protein K0R18_370 [Bacillales bacterium]|jgi:hypothetical protein|nr:hypothetical protein [Bacillales bacterium]